MNRENILRLNLGQYSYNKNEQITHDNGRMHTRIAYILNGSVSIYVIDENDNKTLFDIACIGDICSETFIDTYDTVLICANEPTIIVYLPVYEYNDQLFSNMQDYTKRLFNRIQILNKPTVEQKFLRYLQSLNHDNNLKYITIPIPYVKLAQYLCVDRSALTRALCSLENKGIIERDRDCVKLIH